MSISRLKKLAHTVRQSVYGVAKDAALTELSSIAGYLFLILFFLGSRILAPLHIPLAALFFLLAIRSVGKVLKRRRVQRGVRMFKKKTLGQVVAHKLLFTLLAIFFLGVYAFVSLLPTDRDVFAGKSHEEVRRMVDGDTIKAAQLIDMLGVTGDKLLDNISLNKADISTEERESLRRDWDAFLGVAIASEEVTDTHRYFSQISFFGARELQAQSFTISYALYMKKFVYFHKVIHAVGDNNEIRTTLNEYSRASGAKGSYADVVARYFAINSLLRRNVGYAYYLLVAPRVEQVTSPEYKILLVVSSESYKYVLTNAFSHLTSRGIAYRQALGDVVSDSWLPIQKTIFVDTIGNVHVGDRKEKLITSDDIATMKNFLQTGDIFVARKNWYASNVGIPGFWAHAGIYTGTVDDMNAYFADIFPRTFGRVTYGSFKELLSGAYPHVLEVYSEIDMYGHTPSVIESETRGTRIQSIEHSASVDYFGVVRALIPKEDMLASILRAYANHEKPYDYRFDLRTIDEIFCSELVGDAFVSTSNKRGILLPRSMVSGREIIAPNEIAAKFAAEAGTSGAELSFVYFLDGNETLGRADIGSEEEFIKSHTRPKYSFLLK